MEISITSETILQQTICGDNESIELTSNMEYSEEQTELEKMQSNLKRAREVYFKSFTENGSHKSNSKEEGHDEDENSTQP